ncbi:MAG: sulfite exporter TauE/SafE family protein [Patescibacteria group bacterium]
MSKEHTYYIKGMHCASCEILIEKKLLEIPEVKSVEASTNSGKATIEYEGERPNVETLNHIFQKDNYSFFNNEYEAKKFDGVNKKEKLANKTLVAFNIAIFIIIAFLLLDRIGVSGFLNVTSTSSLLSFFGFGILAGLSSCAALVGGIVLSMSKQWQELYAKEQSSINKFQPYFLFNVGRVLSYGIFGGLLGLLGSRLQLSLGVISFLVISISFLMIVLAFQMLGIRAFQKFQVSIPKFITRKIANDLPAMHAHALQAGNNFNGKYMPFVMGAATFFLPCGFTITAQSLALLSGNYIQGALIMGFFALGTAPMLLLIGLSTVKFLEKPHLSQTFSKVAGFLLMFFALFNISTQMSVLGVDIGSVFANDSQVSLSNKDGLALVVDGKQLIKMTVHGLGYEPNYFKIRAGIPVRWEITASGQPGCARGAVVARGLLEDNVVYLNPTKGEVTTAEFTPEKAGRYAFSCTMNMARGTIEVVN